MTGGVVHGGVAGQLSSCSGRDRPGKPGRPSPPGGTQPGGWGMRR